MFNLGFGEIIILGVIALIFIGPKQLPEVARTVGRLLNEWKRATSDFQQTFTTDLREDLHKRRQNANPLEQEPSIAPPAPPEPQPEHGHEHEHEEASSIPDEDKKV